MPVDAVLGDGAAGGGPGDDESAVADSPVQMLDLAGGTGPVRLRRGFRCRLGRRLGFRRCLDVGVSGLLARAVVVDRLHPVDVFRLRLHRAVGVGRSVAAGVFLDGEELPGGVFGGFPPQYPVAGDALVPGVVPTQRHRVVGRCCVQARRLGGHGRRGLRRRCWRRRCLGVGVAGPFAHAAVVDRLNPVDVPRLRLHRIVGIGR